MKSIRQEILKETLLKPIINNKDDITTEFIDDIDTNIKPDYNNNLPIKQLTSIYYNYL